MQRDEVTGFDMHAVGTVHIRGWLSARIIAVEYLVGRVIRRHAKPVAMEAIHATSAPGGGLEIAEGQLDQLRVWLNST